MGSSEPAGPATDGASPEESYKAIASYEHHFNSMETELRKLASVWLLAALGAVAFLVRQKVDGALLDPKLLIAMVGLMGNAGLLVLWILDQMVYHRLLNSVFLLGVRLEYRHRSLPPIRTLMMLFSRKRGMARFLRLFYFIPMCGLAAVSVIAGVLQAADTPAQYAGLVVGLIAAGVPAWVLWRSTHLESYAEVSEGFGDPEFTRFLQDKQFEQLLRGH